MSKAQKRSAALQGIWYGLVFALIMHGSMLGPFWNIPA